MKGIFFGGKRRGSGSFMEVSVSEGPFAFTAEVRGIFVADPLSGGAGIDAVLHHHKPSLMQCDALIMRQR